LLAEREFLELIEPVSLSSTVDDRVLEQVTVDAVVVDGALGRSPLVVVDLLEFVRVPPLIVH
jgi:hypothetical protein